MKNPFHLRGAAPTPHFIGRYKVLRRIFSRVAGHGQSLAIIGTPCAGKTSVLHYPTSANATAVDRYFADSDLTPCFSQLDVQDFKAELNSCSDFWRKALSILDNPPDNIPTATREAMRNAWQECLQHDFRNFALEHLLVRLRAGNIRLVLLIDDFDQLINHPQLGNAEFFGGLRSLTTRSQGSLVLVVGTCVPLSTLNHDAHRFSHIGSPYFNFLNEIVLDAWDENEIEALLMLGEARFQSADLRFIRHLAGAQPWLLQATAAAVWNAYDEAADDTRRRLFSAARYAYPGVDEYFSKNWLHWTDAMHVVLATLALHQPPVIQKKIKNIDLATTLNIDEFTPELRFLNKQGIITTDPARPSAWRIAPHALNWWLWKKLYLWNHQAGTLSANLMSHDDRSITTRPQWRQLSLVTQAARLAAAT